MNIVSFDDAKARSRREDSVRTRIKEQPHAQTQARTDLFAAGSSTTPSAVELREDIRSPFPDDTPWSARTARSSRNGSGKRSASSTPDTRSAQGVRSSRSAQKPRNTPARANNWTLQSEMGSRSARSTRSVTPANERNATRSNRRDADTSGKTRAESRESSRDNRRRAKTKERANRLFERQYAAESPAESTESAPRAALYEGQMGTKHRKSARMQRAGAASAPIAKPNVTSWLEKLPITTRSIKAATAVLCVVLFCGLLYGPAQQYYQAQREHDRLTAEYNALEERNTALNDQNDILASDAGVEDAVRQKFGYVKQGEEVAYVAGLSDEASAARRDSDDLQANVISSTVKAPNEWYTPLLDTFFGVQ